MTEDVDSEERRRQRSDEARRAAMRLRNEEKKERERQIALDIANVDKKATKRIVFDDSDNEEEEANGENTVSTAKSSSKRPKLFDSEDENDDDQNKGVNEEMLKNRHSGPKGEKLMKLESKFNSDPRFKLDDKFAESDSDDDENPTMSAEKTEMKQEKDKNRELLSRILGKSVEEKKPKTSDATTSSGALLKARPFTRFDPENEEHLEWMRAFEASKQPKNAAKKSAEQSEKAGESEEEKEEGVDEDVEKSEKSDDEDFEKAEIFFKMDEEFANAMKERKEGAESDEKSTGFSFLSMIGRKYEKSPENGEEDDEEPEKPAVAQKTAEKPQKSLILAQKSVKIAKFFVDPFSDEKIKSQAANFRRTQTVEKIIDKWAPHRDAIFKLWKKQRRDAVKKQKDSFFTNGKRKRKIEENGTSADN